MKGEREDAERAVSQPLDGDGAICRSFGPESNRHVDGCRLSILHNSVSYKSQDIRPSAMPNHNSRRSLL